MNRKFTSSGRPYWSAELRFAEDDAEQSDIMEHSLPDGLKKCQEKWGDFIESIGEPPEPDDLSPGQYIVGIKLHKD
jgi:hypothetical protein